MDAGASVSSAAPLTVNQAAEYLGITPSAIRQAIEAGRLRTVTAKATARRILPADLDAYARSRRTWKTLGGPPDKS